VKIIQEGYHVLALFHNVLSVRQIVAATYIVTFSKQLVTLKNVEGWVFILEKVDHRGIYQVGSSSDELSNSMRQVLTPPLALSVSTTTSDDSSSSITGLVMLTWRNYASSKSFKLSMD